MTGEEFDHQKTSQPTTFRYITLPIIRMFAKMKKDRRSWEKSEL